MTDENKLQLVKRAIMFARTAYPSYARMDGSIWPVVPLDPAEAELFAHAALKSLEQAGFVIEPKNPAAKPTSA